MLFFPLVRNDTLLSMLLEDRTSLLQNGLQRNGFLRYTDQHEFSYGYAITRHKVYCLDAGHFHPTEQISDKISSVLQYTDKVYLHLSRGVRWDSDHALLGENGAGKSTLMSVLFGLLRADEGQIFVGGKEVEIVNPRVANALGIGMVHQHFKLVHNFTVTENIVLGDEPHHGLALSLKEATARISELSKKYHLDVDPNAKIEDISVGMPLPAST